MSLCCRRPGDTAVTGNGWDVGVVARVCKRHGIRYPRRGAKSCGYPWGQTFVPEENAAASGLCPSSKACALTTLQPFNFFASVTDC